MISMLQLLLPCPLFLNLVDSRTKKTSGLGHMSKDVHQVTGVLIVEVWAVVPEVFLLVFLTRWVSWPNAS